MSFDTEQYENVVFQAVQGIAHSIAIAIYRYGLQKGLKREDNRNPQFSELKYSWSRSQCILKLRIYHDDTGDEIYQEIIFSRKLCEYLIVNSPEIMVQACLSMDSFITKMMTGINQFNAIRYCECPTHQSCLGAFIPEECKQVGDKWLCYNCVDKYSLLAAIPIPHRETTIEKSERDKMTSKLRFSILERDNFSCRACGRNPREHNAKLHVDHITPIAKGGKTEANNLHTLCQECNLAKSDKTIEQMGLWA